MDTRLLKHYESELRYIREMGSEFAASYPKIAARLGMEGFEVADPYVERLLEGFAFLAARVQLELELQYPTFTSNLLEIVYPHYLSPTPSMMVVELTPDPGQLNAVEGHAIPRHTNLRSRIGEGGETPCLYLTSHDLRVWPIEIVEAEYIDGRGALLDLGIAKGIEARAAIRLRLGRFGGEALRELQMDELSLFVSPDAFAHWGLHELLCTQVTGVAARSTNPKAVWSLDLPEGRCVPKGLETEEALLPSSRQVFDGYRLLQEFFAMPERFLFVELSGLRPGLERAPGSEVDIYICLREGRSDYATRVTKKDFVLNAVPAINLFPKRCDRLLLSRKDVDHHVVVDRTARLDYEVFSLTSVVGISADGKEDTQFRAFYSENDLTAAGEVHPAYYTQSRKMRQRSEKERLRGIRTSYLGSDLFLKLVDRSQAPYGDDLEQLAIRALCTNRDLPLLLAGGGAHLFHLPGGGPIKEIRPLVPPTRPRPPLAQGDTAWRLISHLSLNYLSIAETDKGGGPAALRELIGLYAPLGNRAIERQLEGIVGLSCRHIARRIAGDIVASAVRGIEITLEFDESFFEGTSTYVFASVLEHFFRRQVAINSFSETVLVTQQRGEVARWRPRSGLGRLI